MDHDQDIGGIARALGLELHAAELDRLAAFEVLLRGRAIPLGLVAAADAERLRSRHVVDSLRAAAVVRTSDREALDVGSGAGLPGIVVAIALPRLRVGLVEPRRRRIGFLELALEELGLRNAQVLPARIQDLDVTVDLCFARALARPAEAWRLASPALRRGGRLVYFAGATADAGVEDRSSWAEVGIEAPASIELLPDAVLESGGRLAIMTR
jgi:16S rRNA (guanine527-N7)-methyltransferase